MRFDPLFFLDPSVLLYYVPFLLAVVVLLFRFNKYKLWSIPLILGLLVGGGPLIGIIFLVVFRLDLMHERKQAKAPQPVPVAMPSANPDGVVTSVQQVAAPVDNQRSVAAILGTITSLVLVASGIFVVGIFVLFTVITIQCANDPKCM